MCTVFGARPGAYKCGPRRCDFFSWAHLLEPRAFFSPTNTPTSSLNLSTDSTTFSPTTWFQVVIPLLAASLDSDVLAQGGKFHHHVVAAMDTRIPAMKEVHWVHQASWCCIRIHFLNLISIILIPISSKVVMPPTSSREATRATYSNITWWLKNSKSFSLAMSRRSWSWIKLEGSCM